MASSIWYAGRWRTPEGVERHRRATAERKRRAWREGRHGEQRSRGRLLAKLRASRYAIRQHEREEQAA